MINIVDREKESKVRIIHADLENKHYCEWLKFLDQSENWDRKQIEEYQLSEIQRVLSHAYNNSTGYQQLYDDYGVSPASVKSISDIRKLPFINKEILRDNLEKFAIDSDEKSYVSTGGSTGIPFGFYRSKVAFARELASKAYQYRRVGWKEGCKQLVLRGVPIKTEDHMQFCPEFNELRCSSYHLLPEWLERYRIKAFDYRPDFIKCYPSSGYLFARFLKEYKKDFPPIRGVLCASENLYEYQKELLSEVFHARVFSHYGHYEQAVLAGFCEHEDTYHVLPQYGYAELLDKKGEPVVNPGEVGEIVSTSFIMDKTPFIRYRTRDFARLKGWICTSCGRPYQIWEKIEGRLQEIIITGSGRLISMTAINMHDDIFDHIRQFQFYQDKKGVLEFRYIPKPTCNKNIIEDVKKRLLVKFGNDLELAMKKVDNIPLTKRGKYRFLIQEMKLEFGDE